ILTRCQGDRCVVNRGEGLTAIDFGGGDAATVGAIDRSEGQQEKCCGPQCCGPFFGGVETMKRGICTEEEKQLSCCCDGSNNKRTMSQWWATMRLIVSLMPMMAAASADEVEREGCQTNDVDVNYRAGPESSDPRMKMALEMGATAMLYFFFEIAALQKRSRPTVVTSQKGSRRGGDLLSFESEKELVAPSL
ncbi:hypothetical protein B296_00038592, partial [Ensete ventricosum]